MSLGPSRGVPGHPHHPTRAAAPRLGCSARLGMKLRLSRPPLPPQISLNQKDDPVPSLCQAWECPIGSPVVTPLFFGVLYPEGWVPPLAAPPEAAAVQA